MTSERLTLRWVALYTRGLPPVAGDERRREIESDLWEHRAHAGQGLRMELAVLSRTVRGALDDLSWRRTQRTTQWRLPRPRSVARALGWAVAVVSYALLVAQFTWAATAPVGLGLYGDDWAPGDVEWYSRLCATLLVLLVAGAAMLPRRPRTGAALVAAGAVVPPVVFWWAAPMYAPMAVAIAAAALVLARRRRRALQLRASSATS